MFPSESVDDFSNFKESASVVSPVDEMLREIEWKILAYSMKISLCNVVTKVSTSISSLKYSSF